MRKALFMRRTFFGTKLSSGCVVVLLLIVGGALAGPWLAPWPADETDWEAIDQAPNAVHWFGTDGVGRDLFARTLDGGRTSLAIAALATLVSALIGIPWGAAAGYLGGAVDQAMMRVVDGMYALPFVLLVILLVVAFGRNILLLFVALGAVSWLDIARIVRGQTLAARHEAYVDAARALGAGRWRVILRHIIPNVIGPAVVYATLTIPGVIIAESFISFLGLGVQEPRTSWGMLIAEGARNMHSSPWQLLFPAALLALTLFALNILGDRLRDAWTGTESQRR
ncbi:MAG: ABC transporter permease [Gammaproteobacteria bacterium]|nr:ABC transporter permease [Gammaproteobacteria bacterium]